MNKRIDLLNRENFIDNVLKLVNQMSENKKGCCFAIEGSWGIGKTFVIEKVEEQLKQIQSEETNDAKYFVFHYNCWQHDYYEEPAVAIISAMINSIQKNDVIVSESVDEAVKVGYEFAKDKLKEIAGNFIESKIGVNLISVVEDIKDNKEKEEKSEFEFDELFNFSKTIEKARKNLQEIAKEKTIVLLVDELDRCIPEYAIKVLERLHHIFYGLDNVVVIMAIDRKQLEHSVEEMFGAKNDVGSMDIEKYLKKFIDFSIILDNGKINDSLKEKYDFYFDRFKTSQNSDTKDLNDILGMILEDIDIRRQEKIIEKANLVHSLVCNDKMDISLLTFELVYEVVRIWGLKDMKDILRIDDNFEINCIGEKRMANLKKILFYAYTKEDNIDNYTNEWVCRRVVSSDLYGKVFWYWFKIFNDGEINGIVGNETVSELSIELEVAKKYCEFCEIIK